MKDAKNKILFIASPANDDEHSLAAQKERRIDKRLRLGSNRDQFEFIPKLHLRIDDLQQALLQLKSEYQPPYIIHLSAQGTEDGNIVLANEAGSPQVVSGSAVAELFKIEKDGIRAIILDGSHTEQLGRQLQGSVDYVVSINGTIKGDSAVIFSTHLYQGLFSGRDFDIAFDLGRNQLHFESPADYSKPVLHKPKVKYLAKTRRICAASSV